MTLLLPSRYKVVSLFGDHPVELWYFIRAILKVGVHGDHHFSLRSAEPGLQRCCLSKVSIEANSFKTRVSIADLSSSFAKGLAEGHQHGSHDRRPML